MGAWAGASTIGGAPPPRWEPAGAFRCPPLRELAQPRPPSPPAPQLLRTQSRDSPGALTEDRFESFRHGPAPVPPTSLTLRDSPVPPEPPVILFGTPWCEFCRSARELLEKRGIPYREVNVEQISADNFRREAFAHGLAANLKGVPQISIGATHIGGYTELVRLDAQGKLSEMVKAAAKPAPSQLPRKDN
jgi:glutaredoxin 3